MSALHQHIVRNRRLHASAEATLSALPDLSDATDDFDDLDLLMTVGAAARRVIAACDEFDETLLCAAMARVGYPAAPGPRSRLESEVDR